MFRAEPEKVPVNLLYHFEDQYVAVFSLLSSTPIDALKVACDKYYRPTTEEFFAAHFVDLGYHLRCLLREKAHSVGDWLLVPDVKMENGYRSEHVNIMVYKIGYEDHQ
jgi:hypothetical protein